MKWKELIVKIKRFVCIKDSSNDLSSESDFDYNEMQRNLKFLLEDWIENTHPNNVIKSEYYKPVIYQNHKGMMTELIEEDIKTKEMKFDLNINTHYKSAQIFFAFQDEIDNLIMEYNPFVIYSNIKIYFKINKNRQFNQPDILNYYKYSDIIISFQFMGIKKGEDAK